MLCGQRATINSLSVKHHEGLNGAATSPLSSIDVDVLPGELQVVQLAGRAEEPAEIAAVLPRRTCSHPLLGRSLQRGPEQSEQFGVGGRGLLGVLQRHHGGQAQQGAPFAGRIEDAPGIAQRREQLLPQFQPDGLLHLADGRSIPLFMPGSIFPTIS